MARSKFKQSTGRRPSLFFFFFLASVPPGSFDDLSLMSRLVQCLAFGNEQNRPMSSLSSLMTTALAYPQRASWCALARSKVHPLSRHQEGRLATRGICYPWILDKQAERERERGGGGASLNRCFASSFLSLLLSEAQKRRFYRPTAVFEKLKSAIGKMGVTESTDVASTRSQLFSDNAPSWKDLSELLSKRENELNIKVCLQDRGLHMLNTGQVLKCYKIFALIVLLRSWQFRETPEELANGPTTPRSLRRTFGSSEEPRVKLYRDHAAWCPYCEKVCGSG